LLAKISNYKPSMALCCIAHHIWPLLLAIGCISSSTLPMKSIVYFNILHFYLERGLYKTETCFKETCGKQ